MLMVMVVASNGGPESPIVAVEFERSTLCREVLTRSLPNESQVSE